MLALLSALAVAAPSGFTLQKSDVSGCDLYKGAADAKGDTPLYAECHWPDVTVERFHSVFSDWESHDDIFSGISTSKLQRSGDKNLVFQTQVARGISDRDVLIWGQTEEVGDGFKFSWTRATDEPLTPQSGHVLLERSDGWWEIHPHPDGGLKVTHELRYDPGGSVPGFLVRWFQGSGFAAVVTELHEHLAQ